MRKAILNKTNNYFKSIKGYYMSLDYRTPIYFYEPDSCGYGQIYPIDRSEQIISFVADTNRDFFVVCNLYKVNKYRYKAVKLTQEVAIKLLKHYANNRISINMPDFLDKKISVINSTHPDLGLHWSEDQWNQWRVCCIKNYIQEHYRGVIYRLNNALLCLKCSDLPTGISLYIENYSKLGQAALYNVRKAVKELKLEKYILIS